MSFPDRLRAARLQRGLTQRQLASAAGTIQSNISGYEAGDNVPSASVIPGLCRVLGVSADWLLGVDPPTPATERAQADYRERILDAVCLAFEVRKEDVLGRRRFGMVAPARQAAMWLILEHTGLRLADVGRIFQRVTRGGHCSVINARDKVNQWQDYDAPLWSRVEIALSILGASRAPALAAARRSAAGPASGLHEGDGSACGLPEAQDVQPTLFQLTHEAA